MNHPPMEMCAKLLLHRWWSFRSITVDGGDRGYFTATDPRREGMAGWVPLREAVDTLWPQLDLRAAQPMSHPDRTA